MRKQARKFIGALLLTELLRACLTFLWSLLLIVPGIIYSIRTAFFSMILIEEGKIVYGRDMLRKSEKLVRGHTWDVFWRMVVMGIIIFVPMMLIETGMIISLTSIDERLLTLSIVLADFIESFVSVFFIVCMVALYADLKQTT